MARSKLQTTANLRAIEVQESERPLYKVYRPPPSAHSDKLTVGTATTSKHALPHSSRRSLLSTKESQNFRNKLNGNSSSNATGSDSAALDRLLAPEFRAGSFPAGRIVGDSSMGNGGTLEAEGVSEQRTSSGLALGLGLGMGRKGSDRRSEKSGGERGGQRRRLTNATASSGRSRNLGEGSGTATGPGTNANGTRIARRESYGRDDAYSHETQEELTNKALGVYIDSAGRLHDKEYDPFENVRSVSRRKAERQRAFGATRSRDEDSEVGSDVSGSAVSGLGGTGGFGRNVSGGPGARPADRDPKSGLVENDRYRGGSDEAEVIRRKLMEEHRGMEFSYASSGGYLSDRIVPPASRSWVADDDRFHQDGRGASEHDEGEQDHEEEERDDFHDADEYHQDELNGQMGVAERRHKGHVGNRTRSDTRTSAGMSEYDSGYSAASPRIRAEATGRNVIPEVEERSRSSGLTSPTNAPVARLKQQDFGAGRASPILGSGPQLSSSAKTHASILSREERPRALLFPQTPAQAAAAEKRAALKARTTGPPREETLAPPVAPFNPAYVGLKQSRNSSAPSSVRGGRRGSGAHTGGARNSTPPPTHRRGSFDTGKPASTVFSAHEQGYLPSRWANGDKAFRAGEEEIDRYRPLEWSGSQNAQGPAEADYHPGVSDLVKRNWQELKLAFRFGAHRTKKKIERKVQMM